MKKLKLFVMAIVAMFAAVVSVNAATIDDIDKQPYVSIEKTEKDGVTIIKLLSPASVNLRVRNGEKVVLDLNGTALNNNQAENNPTIYVEEGATLTITDSSSGMGTITNSQKFTGENAVIQPVITNLGNLTLEKGMVITTDVSVYGIKNAVSGIVNINGGYITTMSEKTYGLWNEGVANVSGGQFTQSGKADQPIVVNGSRGELNITGGKFLNNSENQNVISIAPVNGSETNITGGQFQYQDPNNNYASKQQDLSDYLPEGYDMDRYGNVAIHQPEITTEIPGSDAVVATDEETSNVLADTLKNTKDEELKKLLEKNDATVVLEAKEAEITEDQEKKFAEVLPNAKMSKYLDISVLVKAGSETRELHELDEEIGLTVKIPENLPEVAEGYTRVYYILREHNGEVETLETVLSEDGTELSFATDKFSTYVLAYEDQANSGTTPENPNTLDNIGNYLMLTAVACTGLVALGYSVKKKLEN